MEYSQPPAAQAILYSGEYRGSRASHQLLRLYFTVGSIGGAEQATSCSGYIIHAVGSIGGAEQATSCSGYIIHAVGCIGGAEQATSCSGYIIQWGV